MFMLSSVGAALGASGAAAATGATAAGTGFSIASVLQGVATVGGLVAAISSGNQEAAALKMEANDAEQQKQDEVLLSVDRKRSLLKSASESVGQIDTTYAGSGVDLSFGTAAQVKSDVMHEADLALNSDSATTSGRLSRLSEKAVNLRSMAKSARIMGWISGLTRAAGQAASISQQR
jgi:hypothetical protein